MSRLFIVCLLLLVGQSFCSLRRPWMNTNLTPAERAKQLLSQMTSDEKFVMVHGAKSEYIGYVPNNERLGIPALTLNDASQVSFLSRGLHLTFQGIPKQIIPKYNNPIPISLECCCFFWYWYCRPIRSWCCSRIPWQRVQCGAWSWHVPRKSASEWKKLWIRWRRPLPW